MASTRDRILDAAESIVIRDGVARLTLEAAAAEAGLSKGGVLYHFGTRDALVSAMVQRLVDAFDADLVEETAADVESPGRYVRAYVRSTVRPPKTAVEQRRERAGAAILAAMASEPQLLEPLRTSYDNWQQQLLTDGIDDVPATVARLAADGLWLADLFGFAPIDEPLRSRVSAYLQDLARDGGDDR